MKKNKILVCMAILLLSTSLTKIFAGTVTVTNNSTTVVLSNGTVSATITKASATITNLTYNGYNMLSGGYNGGQIYWSWNMPNYQNPSGCTYTLTADPSSNGGTYAEVKLHMASDSTASTAALDVDIYYSLTNTASGIYAAAILNHPSTYHSNPGGEWRMASYVGSAFDWLVVDSLRNRQSATLADWNAGIQPSGAPPEVRRLTSGIYNNKYECKYDYSADFGDVDVWGWCSSTQYKGIWVTAPSKEYYNGGPMKRELMCHNGPTLLNMLGGQHYGMGGDGAIAAGETWQKVYGPFLIYCNSVASGTSNAPAALWADAKAQVATEKNSWPYSWFTPSQYIKQSGRGTVTGKLVINDTYNPSASAANMWVGIAVTPNSTTGVTDFQKWNKNYQFWVKTDASGNFTISHVLPGTYNIYAFGSGAAGQMTQNNYLTVTAGNTTSLGNVTWTVTRTAATVWQIGTPDRSAKEFKHGTDWWTSNTYPNINWGKFMDYPTEFPSNVNFTIDSSNIATDWNFVQYYNDTVQSSAPTWTVNFNLSSAPTSGSTAAVYVSYASSYSAASIVSVNGTNITSPTTGIYPPNASDAMLRKAIHGAWGEYRFTFPASLLHAGSNNITLGIRITGGATYGDIMYDYVRLEAAGTSVTNAIANQKITVAAEENNISALSVYPNPATTSILNVQYYAQQAGSTTYTVIDVTGRIISSTTSQSVQGKNIKQIPVQYLKSGTYMINVKDASGKTASQKFVKL